MDEFPHRHHHGERDMRGGAALAKLDSDHDGRIRHAEAQTDPTSAVRFAAMDVEKDDFVDRADHKWRAGQHPDVWSVAAGTDQDGMLSRTEFEAASAKRTMRAPRSHPRSPPVSGANRRPRRAIPARRTPNDPALRGDAEGFSFTG